MSNKKINVYGYARVNPGSEVIHPQKEAIKEYCECKGFTLKKIFTNICRNNDDYHLEERDLMEVGFPFMIDALKSNPDNVQGIVLTEIDRIADGLVNTAMWIQEINNLGIKIFTINNSKTISDFNGILRDSVYTDCEECGWSMLHTVTVDLNKGTITYYCAACGYKHQEEFS